jgi:hypothetical protein
MTKQKRYAFFVSRDFQSMKQQQNARLRRLKDATTLKRKRIEPSVMNAMRIIGWKTTNAFLLGSRYLRPYQLLKFHYCPKSLHRIKILKLYKNKKISKMKRKQQRLKTHETNVFK